MHYEMDGSEYLLKDGEDVLYRFSSAAVAYDIESGTVHRHGDAESVRKFVDGMREKYVRASNEHVDHAYMEMAQNLVMVQYPFTVEELSHIMDTAGYFERLIERIGIEPSRWMPDVSDVLPPEMVEYSIGCNGIDDDGYGKYFAVSRGTSSGERIVSDVSLPAAERVVHEHAMRNGLEYYAIFGLSIGTFRKGFLLESDHVRESYAPR